MPQDVGLGQDERLVVDVESGSPWPSGALMMVCPVFAKPNASSACRIGHVSVEAVDVRPVLDAAAALVEVAAEAQVPVATAKFVSATPCSSGAYSVSTSALVHGVADAVQGSEVIERMWLSSVLQNANGDTQ